MNLVQMLTSVIGGGNLRLINSATSKGSTIVVPTGSAAGDLIVVTDFAWNSTSAIPSLVTPAGFTSLNTVTGVNGAATVGARANMSYLLATSGISGTTLTGMNGTLTNDKVLMIFRGLSAFATATPHGAAGQIINGDPTVQTMAINGQTAPLIAVGHFYPNVSMSGSTSIVSSPGKYAAYRLYEDAPVADLDADTGSTGTLSMLQSCYIQLTY